MKYVIEIDDEVKVIVQIRCTRGFNGGGTVLADTQYVEGLEPLTEDYVKEHFGELLSDLCDKCHNEGFAEGEDSGMGKAWDCAKMIAIDSEDGGYTCDDLQEIFGTRYPTKVFKTHTVHEALAKLRAYEQKQKEDAEQIRVDVGYEVTIPYRNGTFYVTDVDGNSVKVKDMNLNDMGIFAKNFVVPTGRFVPELAALLEKMKGE